MARLGSVDGKIEWAEQHLGDLEAQIRDFHGRKPYEVVTQQHPQQSDQSQMVLRIREEIPDAIALRAGDIAHNLRSALDHLGCLAVKRNSGAVTSDTAFPIRRREGTPTANETKSLVYSKVKGASAAVIQEMLRLQPYEEGNDESLWALNYLDIVDKHRILIAGLATHESVNIDFGARMQETLRGIPEFADWQVPKLVLGLRPAERFPLHEGYVLYEAPTEEVAKGNPSFTFDIALGEPQILEGKPMLPVLTDLAQAVRATVDLFRPLLY
ncbi:MAG TPA: hypothetical protein VFW71_05225 [Actinomycetota bacterium]|nr:hypothetical protein [Actinomycetota bacterium]